ncbi:GGDEF domain-containing protein [Vibrio japonicus]|uniref:GGDEF domain-containing protein n=1 Tax=Vibrio japonicus TaxID=1824638 RepID=A0ABY5LQV4_9VIBR|nr:GGDEF domain-containing protein [Vibrio japonicus]UUM33079.1 GGDEF domain-containing protein [Vibrio japonicus]
MIRLKRKAINFHSFLYSAKALLLVLSVMLIFANLHLLSSTKDLVKSYSEQQSQARWFLFQLTKEFSELNAVSQYSEKNDDYKQRVKLKYELTWSRFDLLLNNREADTFTSLPGTRSFFHSIFDDFKSLEPKLDLIDNEYYAQEVSASLTSIYLAMIQYVNNNFRMESPLFKGQLEKTKVLNKLQIAMLLILFFCFGLTSFIFHKEARYHRKLSRTDSLTKVKNRLAMFHDLNTRIERNQKFSLFMLDLDGFKQINDNYGHQAGDRALAQIAQRISNLGLPCYRMGGDEFAIAARSQNCEDDLAQINSCFIEHVDIGEKQMVQLSTSIGVAHFPSDAKELTQLISIADGNMYEMKFLREGKLLSKNAC